MDITNVVNKLHADYQNVDNIVNNSLKYSFYYYESYTSIYYTRENSLERYIILSIRVNDIYYLTTIYFTEFNHAYKITPYISKEIYPLIKPYIFEKDNYSTIPYFERICEVILNNEPCTSDFKNDFSNQKLYKYRSKEEYPFFKNFTRKNMSPKMEKKIYKQFDRPLATQIINLCQNTGRTCAFTPDINNAHDIVLAIKNIQTSMTDRPQNP